MGEDKGEGEKKNCPLTLALSLRGEREKGL